MENTRKVVFLCQMNAVGTDSWEFWEVPSDMSQEDLENFGQELANNNAETYGYSIWPNEELEEGEYDEYYDDSIGACMFDYVPEKHDMHTCSGTPEFQKY